MGFEEIVSLTVVSTRDTWRERCSDCGEVPVSIESVTAPSRRGGHSDVYLLTISSNSTSNTNVDPGLITGGDPASPYARFDGQTSRLFPPALIC